MSENEQRGENRVPIALRIKLRYRKVDTFVSKFATNISSNGMFISSRKPKEQGTLLRFELRLADDSTVIAGQGKVAWVRHFDPAQPKQPHGMGIEFTGLSHGSRRLIAQIVAARLEAGLGEADEIPFATKTPAPAAAPVKAPVAATPMQAQSGSAPAVEAGGALDLSHLDSSQVDLAAAVARARALVGSAELDDELEKLYRVSAAPVAETVDEASNDLARMFGGKAVRARRLRHFDPPTGVEISAAPPAADDHEDILDATAVAIELVEASQDILDADAVATELVEASQDIPDAATVAAGAVDAVDQLLAGEEEEAEPELAAASMDANAADAAEVNTADPADVNTAGPANAVIAALADEDLPSAGESEVLYRRGQTRALTDESPEIIGEFDAPASDSADVEIGFESIDEEVPADAVPDELALSLASLDEEESADEELPLIESENHVAASNLDAPMHLEDSADESLDIDIDEESGAPPIPAQASEPRDFEIVDATSGDFAEGAIELTDLLDLPPTMDSTDEVDVDLDLE